MLTLASSAGAAEEKINYQDHALPIFRNSCLTCHNADKKKAGLDLSSYAAAMAGSGDGPVINPGNADDSLLYRVVTHQDEPAMPPKGDKLPDKELDILKRWIAAGAPETAGGKVAAAKPKTDLALASAALDRPAGPLPMPQGLPMEPVVHTARAGALDALATSPWAPVVALGGQKQVLLYDTQTLELLGIVPFPEGQPQVVRFSRSGRLLLVGGGQAAKSGKVVLWDVTTGQRQADVGDEYDAVLAADISPDQSLVALGGPGKTVKLYSTADGQLLETIAKKHTDWVTTIAFSPDGQYLASGDRAGGLWVWEAKTGQEVYNLAGHKAGVTCAAFRGDSTILASASEDGTVKLWDLRTGKEAKSWQAHAPGVLSVDFAHDGSIASCGRDRLVKVWKPDGSPMKQLEAMGDIALHAAFDDEGKRVIAGDWTGDVRVWTVADGKRVGTLSTNPPPLADRLAEATRRVAALQPADDHAAAELTDAERHLAAAKLVAQRAASELASAKAELERVKTAQLAQALASAKGEVARRQAEQEKLAQAANDVETTAGEGGTTTQPSDALANRAAMDAARDALAAARARVDTLSREYQHATGHASAAADAPK